MGLPDLSSVLKVFEQNVTHKTITQSIVNYRPTEQEASTTIKAVVQVAEPEDLKIEGINYSLRYLKIHTIAPVKVRDLITYNNTDYRIIKIQNYGDYGYYECTAVEVTA